MEYIVKVNNNLSEVYDVTYDREKLEELFQVLKKYKYVNYCEVTGTSTCKMPKSKTKQQKIVRRNKGLDNTFVIVGNGYGCSFLKEYEDYPLLYKYLDILLHGKNASDYGLFGYANGNLNYFYADVHREKLAFEAILNYGNSEDLVKVEDRNRRKTVAEQHEEVLNELVINSLKDYDILGLYKVYSDVLKCFNFKLKCNINKASVDINKNGYEMILKK